MLGNSYLLVPSCVAGNGTGHIRRMIDLYRKLKETSKSAVFIPLKKIPGIHNNLISHGVESNDLYTEILPETIAWDFIIVDYRNTPASLLALLQFKGFLIGIDEGGALRSSFSFLIDIIPALKNSVRPNISTLGLMDLPHRRVYNESNCMYKKILITFGGEDYNGLTLSLLKFFKIHGYFHQSEISVVVDEQSISDIKDSEIKTLVRSNNLKDSLYKYDLVFTSFGLIAFESLASGVPFILLNPSLYHHKLSISCGFYEIGIIKPNRKKLEEFIREGVKFMPIQKKYIPDKYINLNDLILSIGKTQANCPVCHYRCSVMDLTQRFETRNFYRCPICSIIFQVNFSASNNSYKKEYFFEEYKKQYGQTYLEDFKNIQKFAGSRLKLISRINYSSKKKKKRLLDIGCAYGPFLKEAEKFGFIPTGIEIIPEAANYVRSELGFELLSESFENASFDKIFDIITMWYVIEHFTDLNFILTKVNSILKVGGIFAFSTPNSSGITARKCMRMFLKRSPSDHISVWNVAITPKIMERFGFKVKRIRVTGHHPERFSGFSKIKSKLVYTIINCISKVLNLGDTFEVYVEKVKVIND